MDLYITAQLTKRDRKVRKSEIYTSKFVFIYFLKFIFDLSMLLCISTPNY